MVESQKLAWKLMTRLRECPQQMATAKHEDHVSEQDHVQENSLHDGRQHEFSKDHGIAFVEGGLLASESHHRIASKQPSAEAKGEHATEYIGEHSDRKNDACCDTRSVTNPCRSTRESPR